ncbi:MAG: hypothetical protein EO766_16630 [Hydrotalea sp. AMD]|uniref:DNA polymerase n=1 Tax=Hydrotalea sp. AMD TaxID=2501297 RepID=UPI001025D045|nr:DNA polymerase [Hydrotalea sp. AMD]RWZ85537.1 MAG: hypothetical protein EO766_16630 [Hydrotalea sp. AMD]
MKFKLLALDTEDDSNGHVQIINFFDGEKHYTFTGPDMRLEAWTFLKELPPCQVWACNLEYDLINLFGDWLGSMVTLQYTKGGLIRGSFRDRAGITFYDSLRHWPIGVKGMGDIIGLQKKEVNGNFNDIDYCQTDTEIVWRFVSTMIDRYEDLKLKCKATLPAMTLQLLERFYKIPRNSIPADLQDFFRGGYYGGRVEIFRLGEIEGQINYYDINSLYPSVMKNGLYPDLDTFYETEKPNFEKEGIAEVEIEYPRDHYITAVPVRTDTEIIYPYGRLAGKWCYPEIRQALSDGARLIRVKRAIEFSKTCKPFSGYVDYCYAARLEAKNRADKLDDVFWKLFLNSCYGKFGMGGELSLIYNNRDLKIKSKASYVNVIWAAYVTSYGRLRLLKELRSVEPYYCDTDSVFTSDELPEGKDLGEIKLEGRFRKCQFIGNKIYTLTDNKNNVKEKAKGINKNVAGDFIRTGKAVFKKPMRFREARKSIAGIANKWYTVTKENRKSYCKRRILKDGSTEPWNIKDFKI